MLCCSVTRSCLTVWDPMDCSTLDLPVLHCLPEFAQTRVYWVNDAIQPSHPLSFPSPPASVFPSITVFANESALPIRWPKFWSFSIIPSSEYTGLIFLTDWSPCCPRDSQEFSSTTGYYTTPIFKIFFQWWFKVEVCSSFLFSKTAAVIFLFLQIF